MSGNPKRQRTQDGAAAAVAARPSFTGHLGRMMGVRPDLTLITSDGHRIPVHRTLLIITSPVFEGCMAAADGGISGMAAGGGGGGGTSTSAGNVAAASKRACPGSADELPVEGTAKEWAALLPLVYPSFPAMVMNMNFAIVNDVIYLAHFYNVRHVLDGCMAFLTSEANALSGDPTSPAYALRWLHVGERLQLDAVAKRCEEFLVGTLRHPGTLTGRCGKCGSGSGYCKGCGFCTACRGCCLRCNMRLGTELEYCARCGRYTTHAHSRTPSSTMLSRATLRLLHNETLARLVELKLPCVD